MEVLGNCNEASSAGLKKDTTGSWDFSGVWCPRRVSARDRKLVWNDTSVAGLDTRTTS
jgi:hypothetical protein